MPNMADIVVKKADGTTNITWSQIVAAGGDKSPALWRSLTAIGTVGQKPALQITSRWNGEKTARRVEGNFYYPSVYTDAQTGLTQVRSKLLGSFSFLAVQDAATADLNEAAAQYGNLLASALIQSVNATGFAPV